MKILHDPRFRLLAATAAVTLAALAFRYGVLEDETRQFACQGVDTLSCRALGLFGVLVWHKAFGWAALPFAVLAWLWPRRAALIPALALSALGLVLYNADQASVAAVLSIVALARLNAPITQATASTL